MCLLEESAAPAALVLRDLQAGHSVVDARRLVVETARLCQLRLVFGEETEVLHQVEQVCEVAAPVHHHYDRRGTLGLLNTMNTRTGR